MDSPRTRNLKLAAAVGIILVVAGLMYAGTITPATGVSLVTGIAASVGLYSGYTRRRTNGGAK